MNKERELLERIYRYLSSGYWVIDEFETQIDDIVKEIEELLAQPEPLTPRQGLEEYKKGYARAELDLKREPLTSKLISLGNNCHESFIKGIRFAEKMHGIGKEYD